jgi:hypothetical protein
MDHVWSTLRMRYSILHKRHAYYACIGSSGLKQIYVHSFLYFLMYNHVLSIRLRSKVTSHLKDKSFLCSSNLVHI